MSYSINKNIFLTDKNVIKCELNSELLQQFREIFDEKLSPELFKQKKIHEIEKIIRENLTKEVQSKFLLAVILNPVFNINYEEGSVLIVNYEKIGIFFYKPKYIDFSLPQNIQAFDKDTISKIPKYSEKVNIIEKENFENDKFLKDYLSAYYVKNYVKIDTDIDQFELKLVKDLKDALIVATGKGFWHIFLGEKILFDKNIQSQSENIKGCLPKRDSLLELSYQFDKNKLKNIVFISQQSSKPSFFQQIKLGWANMLVLAVLFLILFLILGCEEIKVKKQAELDSQIKEYQEKMKILKEEQEESYFFQQEDSHDDQKFTFTPKLSKKMQVMDGVCYMRNELLIVCMIVVLSYYGTSLFKNRKFKK